MGKENYRRQRPFRSVRQEGGSTVITLGREMVPPDWRIVKVTKLESGFEDERPFITIKIERVS